MTIIDFQMGVDIVEVDRIKDVFLRSSKLERAFTTEEITYCNGKLHPWIHFSGRFAGKEAVIKAFSNYGIDLIMKNIEIINKDESYPIVKINDDRCNNYEVRISISHTDNNAIATAMAWKSC